MRQQTRQVKVKDVPIGGGAPVSIQSMTNTRTEDIAATLQQIKALAEAGCEIIRLAVPHAAAVEALPAIVAQSPIPVVADIHFDYRLALGAIEAGVHKLRINPGNIGSRDRVEAVVKAAAERNIPIRIGVNGGSLPRDILQRYGRTPEGMVEAALRHVKILEDLNFADIVISLKASSVPLTIAAYQLMASKVNYPLHIGVTEAGTVRSGTVKSAVGIGAILAAGVGDTIRVSLTGDPVQEVILAEEILRALQLRHQGLELISCPTCARCQIDLAAVAEEVQERIGGLSVPMTVAVMGCVVNGPGEAREADVGIAGGDGVALLFRKGQVVRKVPEAELVEALVAEVEQIAAERAGK
ncbi:MAG: flavodoxin-dependent (E)-4-hydroxy-3-methylbut-2-enyl-diphosphate synthase [Firmicutes bacterium]|nr:flavodoxin-dependent (E)-4-hydroxy-3-methylbut-2-enyl-diphosphate synthase [Bacillota bacterium]